MEEENREAYYEDRYEHNDRDEDENGWSHSRFYRSRKGKPKSEPMSFYGPLGHSYPKLEGDDADPI